MVQGVIYLNEIETIQKQILQAKESRWNKQQEFIQKYHSTIISFKFNIPSWPKNSNGIQNAFQKSRLDFCSYMKNSNQEVTLLEINESVLGPEAFFLSSEDSALMKKLAMHFEESYPIGRLLDIDVLDVSGQPVERSIKRKCYLCTSIAIYCMRERKHTPIELRDFFDTVLKEFFEE